MGSVFDRVLDRVGTLLEVLPGAAHGVARAQSDRGDGASGEDDDAGTLKAKLAAEGGGLAAEVAAAFAKGRPPPARPQDETLVTHCRRLKREDLEIDWTLPAAELANAVRAYRPRPLARTALLRDPPLELKVVRASAVEGSGEPGTVVAASGDGVDVAAGDGALRIEELVPAARRPMSARDFVNGYRISAGERFGRPGDSSR